MAKDKEVVEEVKEEIKEENKNKSTEMIDKANLAAERMEAANKKTEELINRQEALVVEQTLGGEASAGEPKVKVDKDQVEADKIMELTG